MIESFARFQKRSNSTACERNSIDRIITKSTSSTLLYHVRRALDIPVSLVYDSKEVAEEAAIYNYTIDDVQVGDLLFSNRYNKYYLILHQNKAIATDEYFNKFKAIECNISFTIDNQTIHGCLISAARKIMKIDEFTKNAIGTMFDNKTLLMIPSSDLIKPGVNLLIEGRQWKVIDYDNITNKGMMYISLDNVLNTLSEKTPELESSTVTDTLYSGNEYTFGTQNGYFKCSQNIEIINRSKDTITIKVPYGITELAFEIKQFNSIKLMKYKVGE